MESPPPSEELDLSRGEHSLQDWEGRKETLKQLFEKQKSQGGIIDLTETKKMLVISSPVNRDDESQGAASNNGTTSSGSSPNSSTSNNDSAKQPTNEQNTGRNQKSKNHNSHGNSAAGSHRTSYHPLSSDQKSASGGESSKPSAKSVRESDQDHSLGTTKEKESVADSRHQNGRCRRGGYNNRDRRRNK